MTPSLAGRSIAVTGATRGIGYAVAKQLLADGSAVAVCGREPEAVQRAVAALQAECGSPERVFGQAADVTHDAQMSAFAQASLERFGHVDGLVCNAGIYGPKGPLETIAWNDWLYTFDVNVHGVARTLRSFIPALRRSGRGRIAILSGGGATKPMPNLAAYCATKSAVVRLGETVAEELRADNIPVNMIAPGAVNTAMLDEVLAAGPELVGRKQYDDALKQREGGGTPPERGARLCSYLMADTSGITGKLISAVWDPWESLDGHAADLAASDVFTLRRIVQADRGFAW